ncbi:MAG: CRISPR-associated endonuclease Cas1 [Candidatus Thermoplasmatota archaeon]|nr:CRISPR-associated endonuclease Cas1 [Candidatus Thermoplasmatota archaeon]
MNTLFVSKPTVKITASGVNIKINEQDYVIQEMDKISNIMIVAKSGYISIYALRLFALKRISMTLHNLNGEILYHVIPENNNANFGNRVLQYDLYLNNRKKVADEIIKAKKQKYQEILRKHKLPLLTSDIESVFSNEYFARFQDLITSYGYAYSGRKGFYLASNQKATNIINAVLNFYYGLIEHRLLTQIQYYGYDYQASFLHEPNYNKLSLTYDLIEFLRGNIDNIVIEMAKEKRIKQTDFELTKNGYYLIREDKINKYLKPIAPIENETKEVLNEFTDILTISQ